MIFFKWIGGILLICCGLYGGVRLRGYFRRRCLQAEAFLTLLRYIRRQIDCYAAPQKDIFAGCRGQLLADCGAAGETPADLAGLLASVPLYLNDDMAALLAECAGELGSGYREEQIKCLDYYLARFAPLCERQRRELPKWERLAPFLPAVFCGAAVLLLI